MNAPLNPSLLAPSFTGKLLTADHQYDETLALDLYGDWSAEEGCNVVTVMIAGTAHDITTLFSGRQLHYLSRYLDLRGSTDPHLRAMANTHRSQATRY